MPKNKNQKKRTQYMVILPPHKPAYGKAVADLAEGVNLMHELIGMSVTEYAMLTPDGDFLPYKMFANGSSSAARRPVNDRASYHAFIPPEQDLHGTVVIFGADDGAILPMDFDGMCSVTRMINEGTDA